MGSLNDYLQDAERIAPSADSNTQLRRMLWYIAHAVKEGMTVNMVNADFQIGAVELKDGTTDLRAKVTTGTPGVSDAGIVTRSAGTTTVQGTAIISGDVDVVSLPTGALVSDELVTTNTTAATLTAGQRIVLRNCGTNAVAVRYAASCAWGTDFSRVLNADTAQDAGNGGDLEFIALGAMVVSIASASGTHRVAVTVFAS